MIYLCDVWNDSNTTPGNCSGLRFPNPHILSEVCAKNKTCGEKNKKTPKNQKQQKKRKKRKEMQNGTSLSVTLTCKRSNWRNVATTSLSAVQPQRFTA